MSDNSQTRQLAAIVFTDLVGFTELMEVDEDRAREVVRVQRELIDECAGHHGGRVLKEMGDGLLLMFSSSVEALRCALAVQQADKDFLLRIGVHIGDVVIDGEEVYGSGVNIAARIEPLARPGGICLTRDAWYQARNQTDLKASSLGCKSLKGIREPVEVFQLDFDEIGEGSSPAQGKPVPQAADAGTGKQTIAVAAGLVLIAVAVVYLLFDRLVVSEPGPGDVAEQAEHEATPPDPTIAVLPFTDMSPNRDQEYFGEGLAEEVLNLLAGINELRVTGRTSSFAFRGRDVSIPEIGETLGVAHILQGSVRKSGDRLRVTCQLIEAATGFHLWSERFDRKPDDIFVIQDEIADSIARALKVTLTAESVGTDNLDAYENFLQARGLIYQRDTEGLQQARRLLDRALMLDPDYAPALAASGELWLLLESRDLLSSDEAFAAARQDLQRALEINEDLAEAHAAKGLLALQTKDLERAEVFLQRALSINPSLASANNWKGMMLYQKGRLYEARVLSEGFTTVDPLFLPNQSNLAMQQRMMGDYSAARQTGQWMQQNFPDRFMSWTQMIGVYSDQGELAQAVGILERVLELNPGAGRFLAGSLTYRLGDFEYASGFRGGERETRALIIALGSEVGLARAWEDVAESPDDWLAWYRLMDGLAWSGRYQELVDAMGDRWGTLDAFRAEMHINVKYGDAPASLAIAQRELGRKSELGETLAMWRDKLDFMVEQGYGTSRFHHSLARFHALAGERAKTLAEIAKAMELGYRDPLIAHDPAFAEFHDDPEFVELARQMNDRINAERAKVDLPPLTIDFAS